MDSLTTDRNIERYLGAIETGMAMSDAQTQKNLDDKATELREIVEETSVHLCEKDRQEASLLHLAIDELILQCALGTMEGSDKLEEIEQRIEDGIHKMKEAILRVKTLSAKEKDAISEGLHKGWKRLKFEITLLYVRLDSAYEAGSDKLAAARAEVANDLRTVRDAAREHMHSATRKSTNWLKSIEKIVSKRSRRILNSMDAYFEDL